MPTNHLPHHNNPEHSTKRADKWRGIKTFLITGAYVGYTPRIPGTMASFFVTLSYALLVLIVPLTAARGIFIAGIIAALLAGFALAEYATVVLFKAKDPKPMVLDEIGGMGISLIPILMLDPNTMNPLRFGIYLLMTFGFFRYLDIMKPGLIGRMDKREESRYIMIDDLVAGVFTALMVYLLISL